MKFRSSLVVEREVLLDALLNVAHDLLTPPYEAPAEAVVGNAALLQSNRRSNCDRAGGPHHHVATRVSTRRDILGHR